jgi:D-hexose-6-phosphate mutarotase
MAMARTDHASYKAFSDPAMLWSALQGGLKAVHASGGGAPLALPLFGNGQAGINLTPQHLLRLLTLALVDFGRNSNTQLPKKVTVTLHDRCFEELDIREIARDWKKV